MRSFNDWYFDLFESGNGACLNQQEIAEEAWDYRQTEVDELQNNINLLNEALDIKEQLNQKLREREDELQKRVDAVKVLAQTLWEKSEEKHQQGKVWESKTLGECADEILDVLEQALKVGGE